MSSKNKSDGAGRKFGTPHPNEKTRFKPGQSGNPAGRPKHAKIISDEIKKILEENCKVKDYTGKLEFPKMTGVQALAMATFRLALRGNSTALNIVWDRVEGKVALPLTGADGKDLFPQNPFDSMSEKELADELAKQGISGKVVSDPEPENG